MKKQPYSPYYNKGMTGWLRMINFILWPSLFFYLIDVNIWFLLLLPIVLIVWVICESMIYQWDNNF